MAQQLDVVHAIIKTRDKFLLGKRSLTKQTGAGFWATIGGKVENGESLESAITRECFEELGIYVKPVRKIAVTKEEQASLKSFYATYSAEAFKI